ncbi:unnamed protein product [Vicia faba]|uniref:Uncharacterized protein n=1 Tax=Vicia faba TaxID=3906 RepID=A0AAV1AIM1_VICFA|nr:unnamed protein product [Vicia faba]
MLTPTFGTYWRLTKELSYLCIILCISCSFRSESRVSSVDCPLATQEEFQKHCDWPENKPFYLVEAAEEDGVSDDGVGDSSFDDDMKS